MDRTTVGIYEERGLDWAASHATAGRQLEAEAFAAGGSGTDRSAWTWAAGPAATSPTWARRPSPSTPRP